MLSNKDKGTSVGFTENETLSLMYENEAICLRKIADYIEKWKLDWDESVKLLREISDNHEAQCIVVNLRDEINPKP